MNRSIARKLEQMSERHDEVTALLAAPETQADQNRLRELGQEYAQLEPVMACYRRLNQVQDDLDSAREMLADEDQEMQKLAREEIHRSENRLAEIERELEALLVPADPNDGHDVFLEIRAGTGGAEAALFSADLYRMYARYAELQGWRLEPISESPGEHGGYKELITKVSGKGVYSKLKFESGTHRVQRVPETESQGRVHTSACTVAILPEAAEIDEIPINSGDLRIDTYRASGAGGQHVNKTDSAVRITHLPSGIVVECQDERSQHKNRARAMSLLQARLLSQARAAQTDEQAQSRRIQVGSGDRSERIRTYNYPQGRLTDHRINLTLYKLEDIMAGNLDEVIDPLMQEHQAELLAAMADSNV